MERRYILISWLVIFAFTSILWYCHERWMVNRATEIVVVCGNHTQDGIEECINYLGDSGGKVYLPSGYYELRGDNATIIGCVIHTR